MDQESKLEILLLLPLSCFSIMLASCYDLNRTEHPECYYCYYYYNYFCLRSQLSYTAVISKTSTAKINISDFP